MNFLLHYLNYIILLIAVLQSISVSLGVGASTLAVVNYFISISDGVIDSAERRMMKAVYIVLRVAMVLILLSTAALTAIQYSSYGAAYFIPFVIMLWVLIIMLFINAIMMTMKLMPSTIGPALQAATWYGLGFMFTLLSLGLYSFTMKQFTEGYIAVIIIALIIVNGIMMLKEKRAARLAANSPVPAPATSSVPDAHSAVTPPSVTVSDNSSTTAPKETKDTNEEKKN